MMIREYFERRKTRFGSQVFQCLLCPRDFPSHLQVASHIRLRHEEETRLDKIRVSCIMPSIRPERIQGAVRQWAFQTWKNRELIIVWDDDRPLPPLMQHPDIRVLFVPKLLNSIGSKRNWACIDARGELIMHWDDDDLHAPDRIERAVKAMLEKKAIIGGCTTPLFQDEEGRVWRYSSKTPHLSGASLIYKLSLLSSVLFEDRNIGEDSAFVRSVLKGNPILGNPEVALLEEDSIQSLIHAGNTSRKPIGEAQEYQPHFIAARPIPGRDPIVLGMLAWNTDQISLESAQALLQEGLRLRGLGYDPHLCLVDNGSSDDTGASLERFVRSAADQLPCRLIRNERNLGNSIARNQIIDYSLQLSAKYLLFTDGDLEVIPYSTLPLLSFLEDRPQAGCAGLFSGNWTRSREEASPHLDWLDLRKPDLSQPVAWTQYGLFRVEMFRQGIRFEESGPFSGPGWGFEDNDLWLQMKMAGFENACFYGGRYLHRDKQSSIGLLQKEGLNPKKLYEERRQYLLGKWASFPIMKDEIAKLTATELRNEKGDPN